MCLYYKGNFKPCKVGYKVVRLRGGKMFAEMQGNNQELQQGAWLNEEYYRAPHHSGEKLIHAGGFHYPYGWHIFHTKDAAMSWKLTPPLSSMFAIVKVAVKEPVATGLHASHRKITVAKQIKILGIVQ